MNIPFDHELMIDNEKKGLKLVNGDKIYYTVSDLASSGLIKYQEELRYTQNDWKGGHGFYNFSEYDTDKYFEGSGIDTTVTGELFLGPKVNEVKESDDTPLDNQVNRFRWFGTIKRLLCSTTGKAYRYGIGPIYEYYIDETDAGFGVIVNETTWVAQAFTPTDSHTITKAGLFVYLAGLTEDWFDYDLTVSIKATDVDGKPTGVDLCSGTINTADIGTYRSVLDALAMKQGKQEYPEVSFGAGAALTAGTKYVIVMKAAETIPNAAYGILYGGTKTGAPYDGGYFGSSVDSGSNWSLAHATWLFKEYSSTTSSTWSAATTTLAGVTDLVEYNGIMYAAMGASTKYYYSADGNTWAQSDLDDGYANGFLVTRSADGTESLLWKFKTPNEVSSTSDGRTVADG